MLKHIPILRKSQRLISEVERKVLKRLREELDESIATSLTIFKYRKPTTKRQLAHQRIDVDLESTAAPCDDIVFRVHLPSSDKEVDTRRLIMRSDLR